MRDGDGISRRTLLGAIGAAAIAPALRPDFAVSEVAAPSAAVQVASDRKPANENDLPKICLGFYGPVDDASLRRVKQVGVDYVLTGGPRMPWTEAAVRERIDQFAKGGITLCNMMISGFNDVIWGRPGADAQIADVITSIRAAGKAGLPVIEYNFYAHRLIEGYKEETGRAGAGYTAYDYELSKNLPPQENVGTHTRADQLKRARHFAWMGFSRRAVFQLRPPSTEMSTRFTLPRPDHASPVTL